ncbi:alpha/beta-hydrolase [Sparassis crispa]|uniref:Alpha/beta-hydrolase n=1 Tax=Sparassis crispa TaxID=139825 RepID=A0A401GCY6_9APHY|nr:alpha/beta-hydrolase [Sparassis crispa]GBE80022.1 alpha/beta-hydrolase [Sparassis crispa]
MPLNTVSAAVYITPVVIKTLLKHSKKKGQKLTDSDAVQEATDDIFFDEAFHIVKAFIQLGTLNTIESLQEFTNTHVPAPWWAAVSPVRIPLSTCNRAADVLIDWFGQEDLRCVVGGERWWQVRGLDGIDSEWITEKKFLQDTPEYQGKFTDEEENILRMEHLEPVMLYVHGGAYFWGSINTHRYQIIHYARKMKGRAFTVNYRKAPQYPWPCPLQDVLAAYFYLINPPPNVVHKPVSPSKIVFIGDSAGAGLCISILTVLRDMGLPQPAGAVLISPWVDLTHSFPSVMKNAETDIIPPHGFIHKPSTLWPIQPLPEGGRTRVIPTKTNPPPRPGHADTLEPDPARLKRQLRQRMERGQKGTPVHAHDLQEDDAQIESQQDMLNRANSDDEEGPRRCADADGPTCDGDTHLDQEAHTDYDIALDMFEPKPPKVLMENPGERPLELRSQIQVYATTEQLTHPLVSPVLQGSLGNLCPLYILAGDGELLRDEIIYLAHKAAHPKDYPTRAGALREARRQKENAEKFQTPTKVHLQVFDGMCHVLTVFTFTKSAKYAYRSIAEFAKHVTSHSEEHLDRNPFPELRRAPSEISESESDDDDHCDRAVKNSRSTHSGHKLKEVEPHRGSAGGVKHHKENQEKVKEDVQAGETDRFANSEKVGESQSNEATMKDIPSVFMIRERVDVNGRVRPMEPREEIEALCLPPEAVALIKEAPVKRWLTGQEEWDKKYNRAARRVVHRRRYYETMTAKLMKNARDQGFVHANDDEMMRVNSGQSSASPAAGGIAPDRRWGPLDLNGELPPPSAIAARGDTREAVALLKMHIYHSAPATHKTVPRRKTSDAIRAAFDPMDHPTKPPRQSISEQQNKTHVIPVHGLRIWPSLLTLFMRKSSRKALRGKRQAELGILSTSQKLQSGLGNSEPQS